MCIARRAITTLPDQLNCVTVLPVFHQNERHRRGEAMDRKFSRRLSRSIHCRLASALIALCIAASGASARVTTLSINNPQPAFGGASFGAVGTYQVSTGTFTDDVEPHDPPHAVIVDIEHGPKNANRPVSFPADFPIIR